MTRPGEPWQHRTPAWEPIDVSDVSRDVHITTRRLPVVGGWLYMATTWDHGHLDACVCFVPDAEQHGESK
jgi:hypothetical protein